MILTRHFVFLHLHKTGGTFLNECLLRYFPDAQQHGYHLPRRLIPETHRRLPVLGFVRNPWSYYVSWFAFQSARPHPNALFDCVSESGTLNFTQTITNLLMLADEPERLNAVLERMPTEYVNRGLNLPRFALAPLLGSGLGFYSYLYRYMFERGETGLHLGRSESLRADFLTMLDQLAIAVPSDAREFLSAEAPRNASTHAPYQRYYNGYLQKLVRQRDRLLIEDFDYCFE